MSEKHTTGTLDGSTDVSLADAQSIEQRHNHTMSLENEKQFESGHHDQSTTQEQTATLHEPMADDLKEKMATETAVEAEGSTAGPGTVGTEEAQDTEYPAKWRLALITIALCLSVFCMALVG